ncbi:hypothetical protein PIB30_030927 [Stylosanthes scabra]|uniref:Rab3 GTPase-activating protein catalytic subunit n=1 Tax=Stylosanthes scabra TaxID=79078 RepID=A0ABU6QB58_9FABA|nr:hypothetical protein [Stylosanthes scabra]
MESSSSTKVEPHADDDVSEEVGTANFTYLLLQMSMQFEHFDDFTIASSWERFISKIEAICRLWMADGPKNLMEKDAIPLENSKTSYKVKSELQYEVKSYCMEYYFENKSGGKSADWISTLHDLQLCFGVKEFLLIAPQSASGVVLDAPEASKLLSAVAIALSNSSSLWPAFVPVHDPTRNAYIGIQNMGTAFTRRFEADRIGSQVPVNLMHLEGLYQLFVSKFAYSTVDLDKHLFKVQFAMKLTYRTLPYDDDNVEDIDVQNTESGENLAGESLNERLWDDDCSWSEWYSSEDPVKGFELTAIWSEKIVESSTEMEELENASPHEAEKWFISPCFAPYLLEVSHGNQFGFSSVLHLLVDALEMSFEAQFLEDFVSAESPGHDNLKSSMVIPPPTVRDRVLKELFHEGVQAIDSAYDEHKTPQAIKGAPLKTLFAQFCLHSLWVGNCHIRAIAALWIEFVQEVRWCWEESQLLPRMPVNGSIDLSTCLINQKLHMLAVCIQKKRELNEEHRECVGSEDQIDNMTEEESAVGDDHFSMQKQNEDFSGKFTGEPRSSPTSRDLHYSDTASTVGQDPEKDILLNGEKSSDQTRRGSAGVVDSMMLLKSHQRMHAPYTQVSPISTHYMPPGIIYFPSFEEYHALEVVYYVTGSATYDRRHA